MSQKTFLITGCTSGFGKQSVIALELQGSYNANYVEIVLKNGHNCVGTSRDASKLPKFDGATESNFLPLTMDVTSQESVNKGFDEAVKKFGAITHVVNNAGFGVSSEFESMSEKQIRMQFEVNLFGVMWCTKKALEVMRAQGSGGLIQQITSIGGQTGVPTFSTYCGSKWAVEGFTEALQQELKPEWKIKLQLTEPGGFRTEWAGSNMIFGEEKCKAYDHINAEEAMKKRHGTQKGDPIKGARAMYELATMEDPPLRAVIGSDAHERIMKKIDDYGKNYKKYEKLANSTDVDE